MMEKQGEKEKVILELKDYFEKREEILMGFLFGSWAKDQEGIDSDMDIAIYFKPKSNVLEWQGGGSFTDNEKRIWVELEKIVGREIDLLVLNRAPATVADSALRGVPIIIKNKGVYLEFLLKVTSEAIDFREWVSDYWKLKEGMRNGTSTGA